jgi:dTDP-glucose 4,6-dehydratase
MGRIAVLGSNSFAGATFVDAAISAGHEVLGVNRSAEPSAIFLPYRQNRRARAYSFRQLDLNRDFDAICKALAEFSPLHVVDFAGQGMVAESWGNPVQWFQTNVVAKVRLHDVLRLQAGLKKYVRVSTPEVYGSTAHPIREDQPYAPSTPYAVSHASVDMSLSAFHRHYHFPVVLARFANFFGAGQQLYRIVPRSIIYALTGCRLQLHGGGTSIRAFIHARDVADALLKVLQLGVPGEIYHFSPQEFHSIREVVQAICDQLGVQFDRVTEVAGERPGKDHAYLMDASKARLNLQWEPKITLAAGIAETISWVKANLEEIRRMPLDYVHKP